MSTHCALRRKSTEEVSVYVRAAGLWVDLRTHDCISLGLGSSTNEKAQRHLPTPISRLSYQYLGIPNKAVAQNCPRLGTKKQMAPLIWLL
jgi:hypothetical protein